MRTIASYALSLSALLLVILLSACGDVGDAPSARTGAAVDVTTGEGDALAIDTSLSEINWKAAKVTRAHDGGFGAYAGTVYLNAGTVTGVELTVDMPSIWTDTERLTNHLRSGDFFEVEAYPTATFIADRITPIDSTDFTHEITGNLTIRDTTSSVTFPATISVEGDTVRAQADFIIDRKNWGINYPGAPDDLIRDDVRILFDIVAHPGAAVPAEEPMAGTTTSEDEEERG